jgi:hypothetical protein
MTGAVRVAAVCAAGLLVAAAVGKATSGQGFPKPTIQEGPIEIKGTVRVAEPVTVRQSGPWSVSLDDQARVHIAPPSIVEKDRTYDIRWTDAERWERYRVLDMTSDGWVLAVAQSAGAARGQQYLNMARAVAVVRVGP